MLKSREPGAMDTGMHLHTALADLLAKRAMGELSHEEYNEKVKNLTGPAGVEERRKELEKKMEERRALSGGNAQGTPIKCSEFDRSVPNSERTSLECVSISSMFSSQLLYFINTFILFHEFTHFLLK